MDVSALRAVAELLPCMVWMCGHEGDACFVSERWARHTGRSVEELLGSGWFDAVHPEDRARLAAAIRGDGERRDEVRLRGADGSYRWFAVRVAPLRDDEGAVGAWLGTCTDIDEQIQLREALRRQSEAFSDILAMSPGVLYVFRLERSGRATMPFASPAAEDVLGISPATLAREPERLFNGIHTEDVPRLAKSIEESARTMLPWRGEFRYAHPTRGERWLEGHSAGRREPDGAIVFHGVFQDVTHRYEDLAARRAADAALRASESRFRRLYRAAPVAILEQDWSETFRRVDELRAAGAGDLAATFDARPELLDELAATVRTVDANDRARALVGAGDDADLSGADVRVRANPDFAAVFRGALLAYAAGAEGFEQEMTAPSRAGGPRHVVVAGAFPERGSDGRVLVCVTDITARKRDERRLALQATVGRVLGASHSLAGAAPALMRAVCETEGWELGALWKVDPELDRLACVDLWHGPELRAVHLTSRLRGRTLGRGEGFAGKIWATGTAALLADVGQDGDVLPEEATALGLVAAMGFPILVEDRVLCVVAFLGRRARGVDLPHDVLEALGRQIGVFVKQVQASEALDETRRRFEVIAGATSDVLWDWNIGTGRVWWSDGLATLLGEATAPGSGVAWWMERIHADDRARVVLRFDHAVTGEVTSWCDTYRFRRADGSFVSVQDRGQVMCDAAGRPVRMIGGIVRTSVGTVSASVPRVGLRRSAP